MAHGIDKEIRFQYVILYSDLLRLIRVLVYCISLCAGFCKTLLLAIK